MSALTAIAQSGLQAAQARLGTAAHNVANHQTPGFTRQVVQAQARAEGGVVVRLSQASQTGAQAGGQVGGDLTQDVVDQLAAKHSFMANVAVLKTADQMMGSLLDTKA